MMVPFVKLAEHSRHLKLSDTKPCPLPLSHAPANTNTPPISLLPFSLFLFILSKCHSDVFAAGLFTPSPSSSDDDLFAPLSPFSFSLSVRCVLSCSICRRPRSSGRPDNDCDRHGHMHMYEDTRMRNLRKEMPWTHTLNLHTSPKPRQSESYEHV